MHYEEHLPPEALRTHLLTLWSFRRPSDDAPALMHSVPPDGCMGIVMALSRVEAPRLLVLGPHDGPLVVPILPGDRYFGIRFWPDAGGACLGTDPATWVGRAAPAAIVLADATADLRAKVHRDLPDDDALALLIAWGGERVVSAPPLDALVRRTLLAIVASRGTSPIHALADMAGLSPRSLLRRFRRATGLTMKRFAQVRRFREAASQHLADPHATWSRIAADVGYSDHAHLAREFREIVGAAPGQVARHLARISHGRVNP